MTQSGLNASAKSFQPAGVGGPMHGAFGEAPPYDVRGNAPAFSDITQPMYESPQGYEGMGGYQDPMAPPNAQYNQQQQYFPPQRGGFNGGYPESGGGRGGGRDRGGAYGSRGGNSNPNNRNHHRQPQPMGEMQQPYYNYQQSPSPQPNYNHPPPMPPQHGGPRGLPPNHPQHPHAQLHGPVIPSRQNYNGQPMQQPMQPPPPASAPQPTMAPSYLSRSAPKVILVVGYHHAGKTTVAEALAKKLGYDCVSLKKTAPSDVNEFYLGSTLSDSLELLGGALAKVSKMKGLVIDDGVVEHRFEPYFINHCLAEKGMRIDVVVAVNPDLQSILERDVDMSSHAMRRAHPESFEFGTCVDPARLVAIMEAKSVDEMVASATEEVEEMLKSQDPPLELALPELLPRCILVPNLKLVNEILSAERSLLKTDAPFGFTYSVPNFILEYSQFVSSSMLLPYYMVVPWVWGDNVSIIGYGQSVYVHLTSYNLLFELQDIPPPLADLMNRLRAQLEAQETKEGKSLLFSLSGSVRDGVLYISDMMRLGTNHGGSMVLHDRVKLLQESLGKLPANGPLRLLQLFPVHEIKQMLDKYKSVCRGAIFVNPDGLACGTYDSRNYLYPLEEAKTVRVRLWNGRVEEEGSWVFDGYVGDGDEETMVVKSVGSSEVAVPVIVTDASVEEDNINDGNIVECVYETVLAKGGKAKDKNTVLTFRKRCPYEVHPTIQYYQWAFVKPPAWDTAAFFSACASIPSARPTV